MLAALAGLPGSEAAIARITAAAAGAPVPRPVMLSRHHGLIAALEAAHAAYGPTVRLAKRWLGLQLLLESQVRVGGALPLCWRRIIRASCSSDAGLQFRAAALSQSQWSLCSMKASEMSTALSLYAGCAHVRTALHGVLNTWWMMTQQGH